MVGIDRKNENSSAEARDIPASCPSAIVAIDRDVPGNTADRIWHAPIQTACPRLISSMRQMRIGLPEAPAPAFSQIAFFASTTHITMPPSNSAAPMTYKLSRFLPMTLVSRYEGIAVTTKATRVSPRGCVSTVRSPRSPRGKVDSNFAIRSRKYTGRQRIAPNWITIEYIFQYPSESET